MILPQPIFVVRRISPAEKWIGFGRIESINQEECNWSILCLYQQKVHFNERHSNDN